MEMCRAMIALQNTETCGRLPVATPGVMQPYVLARNSALAIHSLYSAMHTVGAMLLLLGQELSHLLRRNPTVRRQVVFMQTFKGLSG